MITEKNTMKRKVSMITVIIAQKGHRVEDYCIKKNKKKENGEAEKAVHDEGDVYLVLSLLT